MTIATVMTQKLVVIELLYQQERCLTVCSILILILLICLDNVTAIMLQLEFLSLCLHGGYCHAEFGCSVAFL